MIRILPHPRFSVRRTLDFAPLVCACVCAAIVTTLMIMTSLVIDAAVIDNTPTYREVTPARVAPAPIVQRAQRGQATTFVSAPSSEFADHSAVLRPVVRVPLHGPLCIAGSSVSYSSRCAV